ncbi:MAG: hypothetical protein SGJ02_01800 [bacterium]|nr:hypothetical protein [bacterium]
MNENIQSQKNFYATISIIFGALAGFLISIPVTFHFMNPASSNFTASYISAPLFALFGARIGYLRRNDKFFFYISFITVLILTTMIGLSIISAPQ